MAKNIQQAAIVLLLYFFFALAPHAAYAQMCDPTCANAIECRDKIAKCKEAWDQMESAKKPHVDALHKMESDIAAFQARIISIESDLVKKAAAIAVGEKELEGSLSLASVRIRQFYIRNTLHNPLAMFLSSDSVGSMLRVMAYQYAVINTDKKVITQTALSVKDLEDKKKSLENEKLSIAYKRRNGPSS